MPRTGFYNDNANRSYPFINLDDIRGTYALTSLVNELLIPDSTIVDFGCVFGLGTSYDPTTHKVWLHRVERSGTTLTFEFRTDVPELTNRALIFTRDVTDAAYSHEFAEADIALSSSSAAPTSLCPQAAPLWEGFLVTGDLAALLVLLPVDDIFWAESADDMVIEPCLIQSLQMSFVNSVSLANAPRTFAPPADNCSSLSSTAAPTEYIVNARCLTGALKFKAGFNCVIQQSQTSNSLTVGIDIGGGEGEPCDEFKLATTETLQPGSPLLTGGPGCHEVIQTINGLEGPFVSLRGGDGVYIEADPDTPHTLLVNVDFRGLAYCPGSGSNSSSSLPG